MLRRLAASGILRRSEGLQAGGGGAGREENECQREVFLWTKREGAAERTRGGRERKEHTDRVYNAGANEYDIITPSKFLNTYAVRDTQHAEVNPTAFNKMFHKSL